ncbi:MAG: RNA polymerase sigma factor [Acidobacteria bacterium]|nr:MAG: RNA polymerase sigma factor [Acidobacteriota bacterium]
MDGPSAARQGERQLVERILAGDEDAFEMFFHEMFPRLYRFVCRWTGGNEDLAEDVTQATLIRAMDKLATWRGDAPLFSWLCTIARREAGLGTRRAIREHHEDLDDGAVARRVDGNPPEMISQESELMQADLRSRVHAALDALPERYARCLEWKYVHDLSVREIALRLGTTEKAAESLLGRARLAFRRVCPLDTGENALPEGAGRP